VVTLYRPVGPKSLPSSGTRAGGHGRPGSQSSRSSTRSSTRSTPPRSRATGTFRSQAPDTWPCSRSARRSSTTTRSTRPADHS